LDLIAHTRTRLAAYKVPKYLVVVDSLPKNPSGKILKRELRDSHAHLAISPPPARGELGGGFSRRPPTYLPPCRGEDNPWG